MTTLLFRSLKNSENWVLQSSEVSLLVVDVKTFFKMQESSRIVFSPAVTKSSVTSRMGASMSTSSIFPSRQTHCPSNDNS